MNSTHEEDNELEEFLRAQGPLASLPDAAKDKMLQSVVENLKHPQDPRKEDYTWLQFAARAVGIAACMVLSIYITAMYTHAGSFQATMSTDTYSTQASRKFSRQIDQQYIISQQLRNQLLHADYILYTMQYNTAEHEHSWLQYTVQYTKRNRNYENQ